MAALAAILVPSPLPAQITFQRTYGGPDDDRAYSVQQTFDGGYIVAGYTWSQGAGLSDFYAIKTDFRGNVMWSRVYGDSGHEEASSVQQTTDSGYVMTGLTDSPAQSPMNVYLVKTNAAGDTMWTRVFGDSEMNGGYSVQQTTDGGYVVAGHTTRRSPGARSAYLIRTDANGDPEWTRAYGDSGTTIAHSVRQTTDGGYVIAGYTDSHGAGRYDVCLIRTGSLGDTLWTRTYGGTRDDEGYSVEQTSDGGYIIAGYTDSYGAGFDDVYLIKTDPLGDSLWARTFGGDSNNCGYSVQQTTDGGYMIAGSTNSFGAGGADVYLVKTDSNGDTLWTRTFGGAADDSGYSVQQTTDGGYVIAGTTWSFGAGGSDVYLIKTDSLGNVAVAEPKTSPTRAQELSVSCEPNPFAGTTTIRLSPALRYSLLKLRIYDAQGRAVRSFSSLLSPISSLTWDGTDDFGQPLPSGAYFICCEAAGERATARLVLQR
jgi:hypothetical protein